ncbi:nucleotide exchange factor GrpE [Dactylosporangium sp. NPDC049525]|uniref:nucleotide exchange factor GrpE n=1 Tax=Dactylosporangium sp. NPDC049525 TaxID=3154730 RepID=UPI00343C34C9
MTTFFRSWWARFRTPRPTAAAAPASVSARQLVEAFAAMGMDENDAVAQRAALIWTVVAVLDKIRGGSPIVWEIVVDDLNAIGVEVLLPDGQPFDPERHELVEVVPHSDPSLVDTVARTELVGVNDHGRLIRRPRVHVYRKDS